jgi:hypothetical protein
VSPRGLAGHKWRRPVLLGQTGRRAMLGSEQVLVVSVGVGQTGLSMFPALEGRGNIG